MLYPIAIDSEIIEALSDAFFPSVLVNAFRKFSIPSCPRNIRIISIDFVPSVTFASDIVDRPVVPYAENTVNRLSTNEASL